MVARTPPGIYDPCPCGHPCTPVYLPHSSDVSRRSTTTAATNAASCGTCRRTRHGPSRPSSLIQRRLTGRTPTHRACTCRFVIVSITCDDLPCLPAQTSQRRQPSRMQNAHTILAPWGSPWAPASVSRLAWFSARHSARNLTRHWPARRRHLTSRCRIRWVCESSDETTTAPPAARTPTRNLTEQSTPVQHQLLQDVKCLLPGTERTSWPD